MSYDRDGGQNARDDGWHGTEAQAYDFVQPENDIMQQPAVLTRVAYVSHVVYRTPVSRGRAHRMSLLAMTAEEALLSAPHQHRLVADVRSRME